MAKKDEKKVLTNREKLATDNTFKKHCENAGVEPTVRQFSKFQMGKGSVYKTQILKQEL